MLALLLVVGVQTAEQLWGPAELQAFRFPVREELTWPILKRYVRGEDGGRNIHATAVVPREGRSTAGPVEGGEAAGMPEAMLTATAEAEAGMTTTTTLVPERFEFFAFMVIPLLAKVLAAMLLCLHVALCSDSFLCFCGIGTALLAVLAMVGDGIIMYRACPAAPPSQPWECDFPFITHWTCVFAQAVMPLVAVWPVGLVFAELRSNEERHAIPQRWRRGPGGVASPPPPPPPLFDTPQERRGALSIVLRPLAALSTYRWSCALTAPVLAHAAFFYQCYQRIGALHARSTAMAVLDTQRWVTESALPPLMAMETAVWMALAVKAYAQRPFGLVVEKEHAD